ncbi:MAG: hypothetical protein M1383_04450 [Patescibacteria group bacterium]|nr:hypothetical protein [Patescibacteria group bacterium]
MLEAIKIAHILGVSVRNLSGKSLDDYKAKQPDSFPKACEAIAALALDNSLTELAKQ